ncbi:MAG: hypothetical protein A2Y56_15805 [Candidatus Aminicenantes bacterium RBG_13_63_10]|nr:MAG: hypothetical protein A2Y56_15805 [Candidatus Aminicenantes bacterium RBG_13_63_10]
MRKIIRGALTAVLAGLVLLSLAAQVFHKPEGNHRASWWESAPGFFALFGFIGCLFLIAVALGLGRAFLRKSGRYYDDD